MQTKLIFMPLTDYNTNQKIWVSISHIETIKYFKDGAVICFNSGESIMVKEVTVIERIKQYSKNKKESNVDN